MTCAIGDTVITVEFPFVEMKVDDVWPDDDGPANPTAEDVLEQMKRYGSKRTVIFDWALLDDIEISVSAFIDGKHVTSNAVWR